MVANPSCIDKRTNLWCVICVCALVTCVCVTGSHQRQVWDSVACGRAVSGQISFAQRNGIRSFTHACHRHTNTNTNTQCALYRMADCLLITSVRDGMNLVPFEYVACQKVVHCLWMCFSVLDLFRGGIWLLDTYVFCCFYTNNTSVICFPNVCGTKRIARRGFQFINKREK